MNIDTFYMKRCLQLAAKGAGEVSSNPMVGSVVVHEGKIIGEGYHRKYGQAHAEVNAINCVKDKSLLKHSTLYVSLEPCSHYGKTPPCSQLIIDSEIPKVVIATLDPFHKVSGRGLEMLQEAGVDVTVGVLEKEAQELNKYFFTMHKYQRPYVILKWAQSRDLFIDKKRERNSEEHAVLLSNIETRMLVHKLRSEVSSIMVGTNTVILDNPSLTTRYWAGKNPVRIFLDRDLNIDSNFTLYNGFVDTLVFTERDQNPQNEIKNVSYIKVVFNENLINSILIELFNRNVNSVLVEGGSFLLNSFIRQGAWDEACIETANCLLEDGVHAPFLNGEIIKMQKNKRSKTLYLKNMEKYKIL